MNAEIPLPKDRLLFVYNADSGWVNMLMDWSHKILRPSTYSCQLCSLTYGHTRMHKKWHAFTSNLSFDTLFLHRDEFTKHYPHLHDVHLPCILIERKDDHTVDVLLDAERLNQQRTLDQLIETCTRLIESRLSLPVIDV